MPVFGTGSKSTWWAGSEPVRFQPMSFRAPCRMGMIPEVLEGDREEVDRLVREFNSRWRKMGAGLRVRDLREGPPVGHYVDPSRRVG